VHENTPLILHHPGYKGLIPLDSGNAPGFAGFRPSQFATDWLWIAMKQVSGVRFQVSVPGFRVQDQKTAPISSESDPFSSVDSSSMTKSAKLPARWERIFLTGGLASWRVSELAS
jgi:hypothetical protein